MKRDAASPSSSFGFVLCKLKLLRYSTPIEQQYQLNLRHFR
jgi:hypothetical protein